MRYHMTCYQQHYQLHHCIPRLRQLTLVTTWLFWSHYAIGAGIIVMWCCHLWHHCIPLVNDDQNEVQHDLFGNWHHWYQGWCHMTPTVLSMTPLHSWSMPLKWEHHFLGHVTPLVFPLALDDEVASMAWSIASLHSFGQDDWNELQHNLFGQVTLKCSLHVDYTLLHIQFKKDTKQQFLFSML